MSHIKIELPASYNFTCSIPVRISDINYGNHVGNDAVLSIIHEARMQYLRSLGYTELSFGGTGMIMTDVAITFKSELHYGDTIIASVAVTDISRTGFDLIYKLEKQTANGPVLAAAGKTGMLCYDYAGKKITSIPEEVLKKIDAKK